MSTSKERVVTSPSTARGQQTRQRLLDAAEEVFGENGYDRASVTEITRRAGVAQGTFYVYFADKKAAFAELIRELSHRLRAEIAAATAGIPGRMEVERAGFRAFFSYVQKHRNLYRIVRQAEFVDEELFRWYYRRLADGYARGLSRAMEAGELRDLDPECLAYCLMGIGDFLGMRWILWDGDGVPDEVFESLMSFLRAGMEAPAPGAVPEPRGEIGEQPAG